MKSRIFALSLGLLASLVAFGADVPISGLPAGTTLAGTEEIPAVQSAATVKTTPAAVSTYVKSQGAALTRTSDTNVTLTLGGAPNTALLNATSITAGWTGTLAVSRGGTGASSLAAAGIPTSTNATTFAMTCTGFASCPGTGSIYSYSKTGNIVCVQLAPFAGTSNSTSFVLSGLPAAALPATDGLSFVISAQDNTTRVLAWASPRTNGDIQLYNGIAGNGQANTWTNSGTKGLGGGGLYSPICYATQ